MQGEQEEHAGTVAAKRYAAGGTSEDLDAAVRANLPLVQKTVNERRAWWHRDDLFSAGVEALVESLATFTPDAGAWSSWALLHIRSAIYREAKRLSAPQMRWDAWQAAPRVLALAADGHDPETIAEMLGERIEAVTDALKPYAAPQSLDHIDAVEETPISDLLGDEDPQLALVDRQLSAAADLRRLLAASRLDARRSYVLARLFGFLGGQPCEQKDVASELGVSRARVGQLRDEALAQLGDAAEREGMGSRRDGAHV